MTDQNSREDEFIRHFTSVQGNLRGLVLGLTPTRADADDVLQEVNLALWRKRDIYDPDRDFLNWACGFVLREIRNFRKKSARSRLWYSDEALESLAEAWNAKPKGGEDRRDALALCIQKLGVVEQECISQYYSNQLSGPEIAERTERPVSTIYKILNRARKALRECVKRTLAQGRREVVSVALIVALIFG